MTDKYYEGIKAVVEKPTSARPSHRLLEKQTRRTRKLAQPATVRVDEALLLAYLNSRAESKEMGDLVRQIEASRKRSRKTQKEIAKLRKRNQALLAKL